MAEDRIVRNDVLAVGILALVIFLVASVVTYSPADPAASQAPSALLKIYQPDQLVFPENATIENAGGRLGAWTADLLINVLGVGVYFLIVGLIALEIALFRRSPVESPWLKSVGWAVSLLGLTSLSCMLLPDWTVSPLIGAGGYVGALVSGLMKTNVGTTGAIAGGISMVICGMMMWTEYLIFRAGRLAFAPALVAATAILPFGLVHGFVQWFNGEVEEEEGDEEYEYEDEEEDEDELDEDGEPKTIRFKRRDNGEEVFKEVALASDGSVSTLGASSLAVADSELEDEEDEYEEEAEEEDAEEDEYEIEDDSEEEDEEDDYVPMANASLNIRDNTSKTIVPALMPATDTDADETSDEVERVDEPVEAKSKPHFRMPASKEKKPAKSSERDAMMNQLNEAALYDPAADYQVPSLELLTQAEALPFEEQEREALIKAEILEKTCQQFGFKVRVIEIETGPVISMYEIDLEPGLRLQKVVALADDLAIAMRVPSVRIVAPIPGKNSVGVEVPNETRQMVRMRGVMEQCEAQINKMHIPLFLGSDAVGAPMVADLAKLPHLLIAGRTGTGKSVCLNAIIASILMTRRPDEVRMLMIDPKMVELSGFGKLPHLMHPVVTDMRKAEAILAWAVDKMEERYALLASVGVRHVTSYNQLGEEEIMERLDPTDEQRANIPTNLPFIVIVADEMADLMMTAGKDVETHIIRLAQKSRAVGIHLILATQKPTVDVITGLIKSNLPARIAFQVASKTDSRVVLDAQGADKLLGCGDMLFLWPGTSTLLRGQGTYLSDEELDSVTAACSTGEQNFVNELINIKVKSDGDEDSGAPKKGERKKDELYEDAIEIVAREQRGSLSMLQRAMGIGYGRAARLIDYMEEDGYVGEYNGSKSREVLITLEMWENIKNGDPNPVNDEDWPEEDEPVVTKPAAFVAKATKASKTNTAKPTTSKAEEAVVPKPKLTLKPASKPASKPATPKKLSAIEDPNRLTNMALNAPATIPMPDPKVEEDEEESLEDEYEYEEDDAVAEGEDDEYEYEYEDAEDGEEYDESDYDDAEEDEDSDEEEYEYEDEDEDEDYDEDEYEDVE